MRSHQKALGGVLYQWGRIDCWSLNLIILRGAGDANAFFFAFFLHLSCLQFLFYCGTPGTNLCHMHRFNGGVWGCKCIDLQILRRIPPPPCYLEQSLTTLPGLGRGSSPLRKPVEPVVSGAALRPPDHRGPWDTLPLHLLIYGNGGGGGEGAAGHVGLERWSPALASLCGAEVVSFSLTFSCKGVVGWYLSAHCHVAGVL